MNSSTRRLTALIPQTDSKAESAVKSAKGLTTEEVDEGLDRTLLYLTGVT